MSHDVGLEEIREGVVVEKRDFNKEAASWDASTMRVGLADQVARSIMKHVELTKDIDALDFGCGTGLVALGLCQHLGSITGIDNATGMLEVFKAKIKQQGYDHVRTQYLDVSSGASLPGHYHLIVSSMALHHVENIHHLLDQFYHVLRPGGCFAIADLAEDGGLFHDHPAGVFHHGFDFEKLKTLFQESGFLDVTVYPVVTVHKTGSDGIVRDFAILMITGRKAE